MNSKQTEADYVPYGPEWEKEMGKFPKAQLIKMLGKAYQEKKELQQSHAVSGDVDELAKEFANDIIGSLDWLDINGQTDWSNVYEAFKSGYAAAQQAGDGWVSVEKQLPKKSGYYICWCTLPDEPGLIHYHVNTGWKNGFYDDRVTHYKILTPPSNP